MFCSGTQNILCSVSVKGFKLYSNWTNGCWNEAVWFQFLRAVRDRDIQLASRLCQMSMYPASITCLSVDKSANSASSLLLPVLLYEPDNPEASEFLPLIQKKLLEGKSPSPLFYTIHQMPQNAPWVCAMLFPLLEQGTEHSTEEEEDDDDDITGSDEESSQSSSGSTSPCSSSSASDDDEEDEERRVNRHKLCPPSHICP